MEQQVTRPPRIKLLRIAAVAPKGMLTRPCLPLHPVPRSGA